MGTLMIYNTKYLQVTQHQGRSESERYGHYPHALASLPHSLDPTPTSGDVRLRAAVVGIVQARLDRNPDKMRARRQTVEHPFGTIQPQTSPFLHSLDPLRNSPCGRTIGIHKTTGNFHIRQHYCDNQISIL